MHKAFPPSVSNHLTQLGEIPRPKCISLYQKKTKKKQPWFLGVFDNETLPTLCGPDSCVVSRVFDWEKWTFINRSRPTAHVEMASLPSLSQSSNITDFSTSNELDPEHVSSPEEPLVDLDSSLADSTLMDSDMASTGSSE